MRMIFFWTGMLLVLGTVNVLTLRKEDLRNHGQSIYLEIEPRDPRSLMQGDYMALYYAVQNEMRGVTLPDAEGQVVLRLDAQRIGKFARLHGTEPLAQNECLLRYKQRSVNDLQLGPASYFFQEGEAKKHQFAKYGELKVGPSGECLLVRLLGPDLKTLEEAVKQEEERQKKVELERVEVERLTREQELERRKQTEAAAAAARNNPGSVRSNPNKNISTATTPENVLVELSSVSGEVVGMLRYVWMDELDKELREKHPHLRSGQALLSMDENRVVRFERVADKGAFAEKRIYAQFSMGPGKLLVYPNTYMPPNGKAHDYSTAKYARVTLNNLRGLTRVLELLDADFKPLP